MSETQILSDLIFDTFKLGCKVLICGNGGLAAESEHFAAEMVGKYAFDVYIPCIALTANSSLITALANDIGYENVFSHQVNVLGRLGDLFIGMTTSRSANILKAFETASGRRIISVAIAGEKSGQIMADHVFIMPGENVAVIQDSTIQFLHIIAYEAKKRIFDVQK